MNLEETDTDDGGAPERQILIGLTYLTMMIASWHLLTVFQLLIVLYLRYETLSERLVHFVKDLEIFRQNEWYMPLNIIVWCSLWGYLQKYMWHITDGNKALATINLFSSKQLEGGGTRFWMYLSGFKLRWFWEKTQKQVDIEREQVHECDSFVTTIRDGNKRTSLEMKFSFVEVPYPPKLSAFLQNAEDLDHRHISKGNNVLSHIADAATEFAQEEGSKMCDEIKQIVGEEKAKEMTGADLIIEHPSLLSARILGRLSEVAFEYGIHIKRFAFSKCDYPEKVQQQLDKMTTARVPLDIAKELVAQGADPDKAAERAIIMAGLDGVRIERKVVELQTDEGGTEIAKALGSALQKTPDAVARLIDAGIKPMPTSKKPKE